MADKSSGKTQPEAAAGPDSFETLPPAPESIAANPKTAQPRPAQPTHVVGDEDLTFLGPSLNPGHLGRLGHYEIQRLLGKGGMGAVLQGFDEKLHRAVAIK